MNLDDEVSLSLRELADLPSPAGQVPEAVRLDKGRALLGNSLSSDFFKNVRKSVGSRLVSDKL